VKVLVVSA